MPMTWDAANEAKLLAKILRRCPVKLSSEQLKEIAAEMGPECTEKAITHRLAKFRGGAATDSPTKAKVKTPSKPRASPIKKTPNGKKKKGDSSDISDDEDHNIAKATPATSRAKRATPKRNYAEMNGDDNDSDDGGAGDANDGDAYGEEDGVANKKIKLEIRDNGLHCSPPSRMRANVYQDGEDTGEASGADEADD